MRYITFFTLLFTLFLFSCGGENTNAPTTTENPNPGGTPVTTSVKTPSVPTSYKLKSVTPDPNRKLENPNIQVTIEGFAGGKCSLIGVYTEQFYKVDSATAVGGKVVFKNDKPYTPGLLYLMLPDQRTTIQLLVDADQTFTMKTKMNDLVNSMQVEGSLDNQLLYQTLKFEAQQKPKYEQITRQLASVQKGTPEYTKLKEEQNQHSKDRFEYLEKIFKENPTSLFTAFKEAGQNPVLEPKYKEDGSIDNESFMYQYKRLFWANVNFDDKRLLRTPVISNKLKRYINELTPQNPDSIKASASFLVDQVIGKDDYYLYFANWIVKNYEPTKTTLMDSEAVYVHMIQNYFTYERAFWSDSTEIHALQLRAYEMSRSLVGQKGVNVTAADPSGKMRSIYDLKDNYIIVYLWNPDCEHCAEQTPQLVNFYHAWKPKGVDVYAIVVNTEKKEWTDAIKKYNMPWDNNVHDPSNKAIYATYFVDNTPEIYVLDPDRTIIAKNLKVDQIQTILERDMKKRGLM